jgi:hypothetical protein
MTGQGDTTTLLDPAHATDRFLGSPAWIRTASLTATQLAALIERTQDRCASMLFTATPTDDLDGMGVYGQLIDVATAGLWRQIVQTSNRAGGRERAFIGDEVALSTGLSQSRAASETELALDACALPGLVEAVETGTVTHWHARVVVRELNAVPLLSLEQRQAIVLLILARYHGQDPTALGKDTARLIAGIDPVAAAGRKQAADARRHTQSWAEPDGQAVFQLRGPNTDIARVLAAVRAHAAQAAEPGDARSTDQRLFDAAIDLLTGGPAAGSWHVDVVVPYSTSQGGDLELADLPGLGPILPATARDLLSEADTLSRINVDEDGHVIAVDTPRPVKRETVVEETVVEETVVEETVVRAARPAPVDPMMAAIKQLAHAPVTRPTGVAGYTVPTRLRRYLQARDRTCTFPGCHRRVTDKDHAIPWPLGPTDPANLGCLCRHHHQAKQNNFTITRLSDGTVRWITRGNQYHDRPPQGF